MYLPVWQRHDEDMTTAVDWGSVQRGSALAAHLPTHSNLTITTQLSIINTRRQCRDFQTFNIYFNLFVLTFTIFRLIDVRGSSDK